MPSTLVYVRSGECFIPLPSRGITTTGPGLHHARMPGIRAGEIQRQFLPCLWFYRLGLSATHAMYADVQPAMREEISLGTRECQSPALIQETAQRARHDSIMVCRSSSSWTENLPPQHVLQTEQPQMPCASVSVSVGHTTKFISLPLRSCVALQFRSSPGYQSRMEAQ